jgi:hypothetical protein
VPNPSRIVPQQPILCTISSLDTNRLPLLTGACASASPAGWVRHLFNTHRFRPGFVQVVLSAVLRRSLFRTPEHSPAEALPINTNDISGASADSLSAQCALYINLTPRANFRLARDTADSVVVLKRAAQFGSPRLRI